MITVDEMVAKRQNVLALRAVRLEVKRQRETWGEQNHDNGRWLEILIEELGEASQAGLQGDVAHQIKELSHVAAVAVSWMLCLQRRLDSESE